MSIGQKHTSAEVTSALVDTTLVYANPIDYSRRFRFQAIPANPTRPEPRRSSVPGSGTGAASAEVIAPFSVPNALLYLAPIWAPARSGKSVEPAKSNVHAQS